MSRFGAGLRWTLCAFVIFAVPSMAETVWPSSLTHECQPVDAIAKLVVPAVELEAVRLEDQERERAGLAPRYAIPHVVQIRPQDVGTWEHLDDGTLLWRYRIVSSGALSINLGFSRYLMSPGGRLHVYAADYSHLVRAFTEADNEKHGELWTPVVLHDDVVVELSISEAMLAALDLELGSVNVGYRGFGEFGPDKSGSCNVDVICPEGDGWRDQIQSVGVISTGGSLFCTGFMVNNTAFDRTPYFMTANHCGISSGNAASLVVYWNYQNSTCRPPGSPASGGPGDGLLNQFQTGSYFRSAYSSSDFTLVELDDDSDPEWNIVFAGWDRSSADSTSAVGIHHPNCDEKRISFEYQPTTTTSYLGTSSPGNGTHIRVTDWDLGTTEPGSSGSPLFNQDKRVVGQLHGGYAACGNNESDWYGRFSVSWTGGGSNSTRLSNWLDSGNTGLTAIDHLSSGGLNVTPEGDVLHVGKVGGPFTNPTVTYTLTNPGSQSVDYEVSLTASFGILLDGTAGPVAGTLAGNGGTTNVVVTLGPAVSGLGPGIYVEDIVFDDLTNGASKTRRHTVEVGQTLFTVTPQAGLVSGGPAGGPFPGAIEYTVTSEKPQPVTVEVTASEPWIALAGGSGPLTLNLDGTGAYDTVIVGISAVADSLPVGVYDGTVSFTNLSGGEGDTTRSVRLDIGRVVHGSTDTPQAIVDYTTISSTIQVSEAYCIGDVDIDVNISHSYIGDLIVDLQSPGGTNVRLHNRTGGSGDNIVRRYDDESVPPDGPGALADFDLESTAGLWTLMVFDGGGGDTGVLNSWALRVAPTAGDCLVPELIHSFSLDSDPGWTREGQWQFGQPTGGGTHNGDPTGGYTGLNVYGYNLSGDYANNITQTYYLTTTPIDCSNITGTRLWFRRWLGVESALYDKANIQVSSNGTDWTTVWVNDNPAIADTLWSYRAYDISAVADGQAAVYLRWGMGPTDKSSTYPGWNIDDVEIWGVLQVGDCNHNGITDDCDLNCGEPGGLCDVPGCGQEADCNGNGVPDECDIAAGTSGDCDGNGLPDECECVPSAAPTPEPDAVGKNRYVSFAAGNAGCPTALRVTLADLPAPFDAFNGATRWVGPPRPVTEASGSAGASPEPTFMGANLQTAPHCMDWSTVGVVHVFDDEIVPGAQYAVQAIHCDCDPDAETGYSAALTVFTSIWGDLVGSCAGGSCTAPDGDADFEDVSALVDTFKDSVGAIRKVRADVAGDVPDAIIDFVDVSSVVDAFRGLAYPFDGPLK